MTKSIKKTKVKFCQFFIKTLAFFTKIGYIKYMNEITVEKLQNLGVYELRELARNLGVSSPTTKKRNELCEEILKILSGEKIVHEKKTNKGRPPKSIQKIQAFASNLIPHEILQMQKPKEEPNSSNILSFAQDITKFNEAYINESRQVTGYVNSINNHFYLKNLKNYDQFKEMIFYISPKTVEKYSLREGDKIFAYGKLAENYNCGLLDQILKINNIEIAKWDCNRKNLDISGFLIPNKLDNIFDKPIKKGERTLSFFPNAEDAILQIVKEIEKQKDKVVLVGVELAPEIIYYGQSKPNLELFATTYYNTLEESYTTIVNCINYCNTILKSGEEVRLFIFDILGMLTRLDLYFSQENKFGGHNVSSLQLVKKLVGMGKAILNNVSITTHAIAFENEKNDDFIKTEVEKISKII